jgi:hypothetical protein
VITREMAVYAVAVIEDHLLLNTRVEMVCTPEGFEARMVGTAEHPPVTGTGITLRTALWLLADQLGQARHNRPPSPPQSALS